MNQQSKLASIAESFCAAIIAAPSAIILNDYCLTAFGNELTDPSLKGEYLFISWCFFFLHSVVWKYIFRRLFNKYGWEPKNILSHFVKKETSK